MPRIVPKIPFVNLHAHTSIGSPFDALGYPSDHFDFAYQNGLDAHAITEHGNCNSFAYAHFHEQKMRSENKNFKYIKGLEAYFIASLEEWQSLKDFKEENDVIEDGIIIDDGNDLLKKGDPLRKKCHIGLLARNQKGLSNLFKIVSTSWQKPYFYYYPRIDFDLIEKYSDGLIGLSGCLGGFAAQSFWSSLNEEGQPNLDYAREDLYKKMLKMLNIFGPESWFGELQWNNIPEQHIVNKLVIEISKELNIDLISSADCHYPSPDLWKDRELYRRWAILIDPKCQIGLT